MKTYLLAVILIGSTIPHGWAGELPVPKLVLSSPRNYQVFQRKTISQGAFVVSGSLSFADNSTPQGITLEGRLTGDSINGPLPETWELLPFDARVAAFQANWTKPAGGWYKFEMRARFKDKTLAEVRVEYVGIGEVFLIAGQSNAANHGEKLSKTATHYVSAFNGTTWAMAHDPQPGASGKGGSFIPAFGDVLYEKYKVPIGVAAVAVGATSVRQWLPKGEPIAHLPTRTNHIVTVGPNQWESSGRLFDNLMTRLGQLGHFRAILWHQGESDANQDLADRTLLESEYRAHLETIIRASRRRAGWDIIWFVAQATYHGPQDTGSPDIRAAQKSLWVDGVALEGPDTDSLTGDHREMGGRGVHFSAKGLQAHGSMWAEKVFIGLKLD